MMMTTPTIPHQRRRRIRKTHSYRWMILFLGCFLFLLLLYLSRLSSVGSSNTSLGSTIISPMMQRRYEDPHAIPMDVVQELDAILVLGGGVPVSWNHPPTYVETRAKDAMIVIQRRYQQEVKKNQPNLVEQKSPSLPILCLSAGTAHLPQLLSKHDGLPIWESTACAAYLMSHNETNVSIQKEDIFVETTSYDTIGNAFYTRTTHTDLNGWRNILIITNDFHMDRTQAIFDWIFLQCSRTTPSTKRGDSSSNIRHHHDPERDTGDDDAYRLFYLASANTGLSQDAIQARQQRESKSAEHVKSVLAKKYQTLERVWHFMNTEHSLYTASHLVERAQGKHEEGGGSSEQTSAMVRLSYGG